jgi:RNA polymerase sigma-70 factor (ECF subfamily)
VSDGAGRHTVASDAQLMAAVGQGDVAAFDTLVVRHQQWAWRAAYRFLGDRQAAEDIAQEAFLRVLDAARRGEVAANFRTYLYTIVTRLCLDYAEKKAPAYTDRLPPVPDHAPAGLERTLAGETEQAIRDALDALPPNYRMVVVLRYFEGLSAREAASALSTSPKGVERLLARAREALRVHLGRFLQE